MYTEYLQLKYLYCFGATVTTVVTIESSDHCVGSGGRATLSIYNNSKRGLK